jgi:hypothetical protein
MKNFRLVTLVDITETGQYRRESGKELAYDQQQNFQILIQTIGLRVNPIYQSSPQPITVDIKDTIYGLRLRPTSYPYFGKRYSGNQKVWVFDFSIEYDYGLTDSHGNDIGLLADDLHFVPIIPALTESVNFTVPVFNTKSFEYRNTLIFSINTV